MTRLHCELRDRLLEAMGRREMTQAALARKVGVSTKHLNQMLQGHAEGTLTMWQELFDATAHRVDIRVVRKPKVEL